MRIKITKEGIYGNTGPVPIGTELTVSKEPAAWAGKYEVIGTEEGKEAVLNAEYAVLEKGRGWFSITLNGEEVTKSLREDDVSGFDSFTDAEKAEFVAQNAKD